MKLIQKSETGVPTVPVSYTFEIKTGMIQCGPDNYNGIKFFSTPFKYFDISFFQGEWDITARRKTWMMNEKEFEEMLEEGSEIIDLIKEFEKRGEDIWTSKQP